MQFTRTPAVGPLVGQRLGQVDHRGLGRGVERVAGAASGVGRGGEQQQRPRRLGQVREELLGDEDRRQVVDLGGGVDRLLGGLGQLAARERRRPCSPRSRSDRSRPAPRGRRRRCRRGAPRGCWWPSREKVFTVGAVGLSARSAMSPPMPYEPPKTRWSCPSSRARYSSSDSGCRVVGRGQLEQLVGDVDVDRLGHLHVALVPGHDRDRHVGQVAQHHGAVVGGGEVRVLRGLRVRGPDGRQPERLRRLSAAQQVPGQDVGHHRLGPGSTSITVSAEGMAVSTAS